MTIIQSSMGLIFGGVTYQSWSTRSGWVVDYEAYLFSVTHGTYHKVLKPSEAIRCDIKYGPTFGSGNDIYICDKADINRASHTQKFGIGYEAPSSDICYDPDIYLAGSKKFTVKEIEVYSFC